jgi:uncharacterized membrane protein
MRWSQRLLAAFFTFTGVLHFAKPRYYEAIVPPQSPVPPKPAVQISGVAEIAGGLAVLSPPTRRFARWWLLALLVAVFPANIYMAVKPEEIRGLDLRRIKPWMLWARLPLQFVCMRWVWSATER